MAKQIKDNDGNVYVQKKVWYKRWWVWVIIIIVLLIGFGSMGSDDDSSSSSSSSNSSNTTSKTVKNTAKEVTLGAGTYKTGQDIKPGRYEIKATQGSGNLTTSDGDVNEILGTKSDSDDGQVTHVTTDLSDGQTLDSELQQIQLIKK